MSVELEGLWATVVHDATSTSSLEGMWATVVHDATSTSSLQGMWATVVHDAVYQSTLEGLWLTVVHDAVGGAFNGIEGSNTQGGVIQVALLSDLGPGNVGY